MRKATIDKKLAVMGLYQIFLTLKQIAKIKNTKDVSKPFVALSKKIELKTTNNKITYLSLYPNVLFKRIPKNSNDAKLPTSVADAIGLLISMLRIPATAGKINPVMPYTGFLSKFQAKNCKSEIDLI